MKRIVSALLLLSILLSMLCGCQSNSQDSDTDKETTGTTDTSTEESAPGTSTDSTEPFEEYAINITADLLYLYKEPNYEAETVGILEKGAYIVVDETSHSFGGVPLRWAKLKGYDGWIILNYINDDYIGEDWSEYPSTTDPSTTVPETSGNTQKPETDTPFKSYKIKVQNNCLSVYSQPKMSSTYWLYDITDHRTITVVEEREVLYYVNYHTWARLESGGWVRLDAITDTANNTEDTTTTKPDTSAPETTKPDDSGTTSKPTETEKPKLNGTLISGNIYGCGTKHSKTVNGLTFCWYDRYEKHDYSNTVVEGTFEFISFSLKSEPDEEGRTHYDAWVITAETKVSDGSGAHIKAEGYDKNDYYLGNTTTYVTIVSGGYGDNDTYLKKKQNIKIKFRRDWMNTNTHEIIIYPNIIA